ncbi:MAG: hypothetical protein ACREBO_14140 [Novosphingobium sp.]
MTWLIPFIVGWWGTMWWPGITHDAPPLGPHPEPWWWRLGVGILGGVAAIVVLGAARLSSEPMPGIIAALATGGVAAGILGAVRSATRSPG